MVAALLGWHEAHAPARAALVASVANRRHRLVIPAPALIEAYSVMTRLPAPHRLAPTDAVALLEGSFQRKATMVGLNAADHWSFLQNATRQGVAGGRTYDARVLECARAASATRLLTLDRRDFERLEPGTIEIVVPA